MDFTRLNQGEKIAGLSGIGLFLTMVIFKWFGVQATSGVGGFAVPSAGESRNAFGSFGFIDIVLLITCIAAVGLALIVAAQREGGLAVAASGIVAGLGVLSVVLIIISIISPPSFLDASGGGIDYTRKIGVWLGLALSAGVVAGGYLSMQTEGTSIDTEPDRFPGSGRGEGRGSDPPPQP